ncbi:MAG TPA: hypothetical protein VNJ46_04945 [Gaiellaceae bacterium]|nr:hypothetical protein [Gaiellaceae bacterium]
MSVTAAERADFRRIVGPALARAASDLAGLPDPGAREAGAVELLPGSLLELPEGILAEALDVVAGARGGPELLAGLAVSGPTPVAVRARALLAERGHAPAGLGALRVERAWEMDADEPVLALFLLCSRERAAGRQLFSFVLERALTGGAVKDGFVSGTSEGTRIAKKVTGEAPTEVAVRELEPGEAAERVVAAARRGAREGLAPSEDGLRALTVFLRAAGVTDADAIVQALELGESLPDRIDALEDEARAAAVDALAAEARGWVEGRGLGAARAEAAAFAAGLMGDFRAFHLGLDVAGWDEDELEEFLLDWVPRKVALEPEEAEAFPQAVADVLGFLGASGRLPAGGAERLAAHALALRDELLDALADPALGGPARLLLQAMAAEGVELGDAEAMRAWLEDFNARPFEERNRILGPALAPSPPGRRAPARPRPKAARRKAQRQARRRNRGR